MRRLIEVVSLLLLGTRTSDAQQWIEARSANYSIFYEAGNEHDVEFARTWMNQADDLMKNKYGVIPNRYYISFYLHPAPTQNANVGTATLLCCGTGTGGIKTGSIHYLTPSAAAWKESAGATTSLGLPFDDNYHAKVIMSEYITVGHYAVQESRTQAGGWSYYNAPSWFIQGLQEFDAIFHTTAANRDLTQTKLREWAGKNLTKFICCSTLSPTVTTVAVSDVYNGGALFVAFLAAQFGEDIHARLLRNTASTFETALASETLPYDIPELFKLFRNWFNGDVTTLQRRSRR